MVKRILSFVLVLVLCVGAVPVTAAEPSAPVAMDEHIAVSGDSSFGSMLAAEIEDELADQQENNGYRIFEVTVADITATVQLEAVEDCTLVVGIYTEDQKELLVSGWREITAGEAQVTVTLETAGMPEYFYLKAFLVDEEKAPLCPAYSTPNYTKEMQEFFAATVEDFEADRVLNLDDNPQNNFAVFKESVKRVDVSGKNTLSVNGDQYIFQNADETVKNLQPGDVITCPHDGDTLILVVATVQAAGDTVTLTEADASLQDVFDYVKIDGEAGLGETSVGEANCPDGVIFDGLQHPAARARAVDFEGQASFSAKFTLFETKVGNEDGANGKLSGSLNLSATASVAVYLTTNYSSVEVKIDYKMKAAVAFSGKLKRFQLPLGVPFTIMPVPTVTIKLTPTFVGEVSGKVELSGTLKGTVGFSANTDEGMTNLSSSPTFDAELKGEVTVFVGLSLEPEVSLVHKKLLKASLDATVGAEVKGELSTDTLGDEHHQCNACLDGDISAKLSLEFEVKFLNHDKWSFKLQLLDVSVKVLDFYWAIDKGEFGWGTCPYISYKMEVTVLCADGTKAKNADVTFDGDSQSFHVLTEEGGVATAYVPNGVYTVKAAFDGETATVKNWKVKNKDRAFTLQLGAKEMGEIAAISAGEHHSAALTVEGELFVWGDNRYGQLGIGSAEQRLTPTFVMSGVKQVCLGDLHSGALTPDGDLYVWGNNQYGQVGDGTTTHRDKPVKVMEGVKDFALGYGHTAAILENGDLYLWGTNSMGALGVGDESVKHSAQPVKVMESVKAVSLGMHSAAVKQNGDLYTWGCNYNGAVGDGTKTHAYAPVKVLDGVVAVELGHGHSAAIKQNGDLYMWGFNYASQLGIGSTKDALSPVYVTDKVTAVSASYAGSGALKEGGDLYIWGGNYNGQLGFDKNANTQATPKKLLSGIQQFSGFSKHCLALSTDGTLYVWGANVFGQLGLGNTDDQYVVVSMRGMTASAANVPLLAAAAGEQTATFEGLTPGAIYNFYVMGDKEAEEPFGAENLWYIDQGVAGEDGTLTFRYVAAGAGDRFVTEMPAPVPAGVLGDVDGDESITSTDARMVLQYYAKKIDANDLDLSVADVDRDGNITSTDARLILQKYAGKIKEWP